MAACVDWNSIRSSSIISTNDRTASVVPRLIPSTSPTRLSVSYSGSCAAREASTSFMMVVRPMPRPG
jgi:hypothetical protein